MFSNFGHLYCVGQDDDVIANVQSTPVSSRNPADFERYLVAEVETRDIRSIETGWCITGGV